jgi:hypothetical protein
MALTGYQSGHHRAVAPFDILVDENVAASDRLMFKYGYDYSASWSQARSQRRPIPACQ